MPRSAKIALIVLGILLVIGLLVPYVVDVDHYRPRIIAEVESRTGRKIEIGQIRARLIPSAGFTIEKVTLGPPAGFAGVNLLTADGIQGSVALSKLLHGEVEVTSVEIVNPHVTLATDEHGRTNYDFATPGAGRKSAAAPASSPSTFVLDSLDIKGAELNLVDVRGRRVEPPSAKISNLDLELSGLDFSSGGMKNWTGEAPLSGVKIELAGLPPISFRSGSLKLEKGAATGNGEADLGNVARVKGDFSIPDLQKGVLNFTLSTPELDLNRLIAAIPASPKAAGGGDPPAHASPGHGNLVAKGKITTEKLLWAPYEATHASADVRAYGDHIDMPATMSFYGGSLGVNPHLDSVAQRLSAGVQASQVDLEKLVAADPSTRGKITGHGDLKMQLSAPLHGDLMKSLTGQGNFALHNGRLPGMHLGNSMAQLRNVEKFLSFGASGGGGAGGETTFSLVQGDLDIHGARILTNHTHADTNVGSGDIGGSVGFDQTLDLAGTWLLTGASRTGAATAGMAAGAVLTGGLLAPALLGAGGSSLRVPFTVKGTLKDPKLVPGGGFPGVKGGSSQPASTTQQQPTQQKKKMFGFIPKP